MTLLASLCSFGHLFEGLTNRSLRPLVAGFIPGYSAGQMTYDLRRKGLLRRIPRTQRYELTREGRRLAVSFTKTYTRIVNPSLSELDPTLPDAIVRNTARASHGGSSSARLTRASRRPLSRPEKMTHP